MNSLAIPINFELEHLSFYSVYLLTCYQLCEHLLVWMSACGARVWKPKLMIFPASLSISRFLRHGLSLNPKLINLAGLASQWAAGIHLCPPVLGLPPLAVLHGFWGSECYVSGILPTEQSLQRLQIFSSFHLVQNAFM